MPDSDEKQELGGVARSIAALFSDQDGEPAEDPPTEGDVSEDLTWQGAASGSEVDAEPDTSVDADPDALASALDTFLATPQLERGGQSTEIRELVTALREANALDPLANAVERLVLEAGDDEASLALAHLMVTAGVATRIAARLGSERDEARRAQLIQVCNAIGLEMAVAISDTLSETTDRFVRRTLMDAMIAMGATGMSVIEQMIEDGRWFVVRNGLAILGEVGGERAVELVTSSLANTDGRVRKEALLALAKIGGGGGTPACSCTACWKIQIRRRVWRQLRPLARSRWNGRSSRCCACWRTRRTST